MENDIPNIPVIDEEKDKKLIRTLKKNNKYEIKFCALNEKLYIQCLDEIFPYSTYENNYNLNNLMNVHKYFQTYKDIKDVCLLIKSINDNLITIEKNNQNIIIRIKFSFKEKLIDIDLELLKLKTDYDKIILDLFNKINEIKKEINIVKNANENKKNIKTI